MSHNGTERNRFIHAKFVVVQRKRKRSSSREGDFRKRDINDTSSCSESASQVFSSENDIGSLVGVPLTDADRRKVLFTCWSPPSGFSFPYVTVGAQKFPEAMVKRIYMISVQQYLQWSFLQMVRCVCSSDCPS